MVFLTGFGDLIIITLNNHLCVICGSLDRESWSSVLSNLPSQLSATGHASAAIHNGAFRGTDGSHIAKSKSTTCATTNG